MKTSLRRIYTEDHIELVGLLYEPETPTSKVLVHVHGMAGNFYENKFLDYLAQTLTDNGIAFFVFNNRDCEFVKDLYKVESDKRTTVQIGSAYERFEDSVLDISAAIDFAEKQGFSEIHLGGHSLGSPKIAFYFAETQDIRIKSILFISPPDMLGLVRMEKEQFQKDITEARELADEGQGKQLVTHPIWGEYRISADTYISLFADDSKDAIFNFLDPAGSFDTLGKITVPTFAVMGHKDDALVIPLEETFEKLSKALSSSPKVETRMLGDANHGYIGNEQDLAGAVKEWLSNLGIIPKKVS